MLPATAPAVAAAPAAAYLVLDLETGDAPAESVEAAIAAWKAPSNIKDLDKIEARRQEAAARFAERAALLDDSPILCVSIQTDSLRLIFNGMTATLYAIQDWSVIPCGNEGIMLRALRNFLDCGTSPETVIVGHNLRAFDLPKLRHAYIRHGLKLPELLKPRLRDEDKAETVDTAALFKAFSMEHRDDFCPSLDTVAATLRIPRPKQYMSGADCPRLYREGEIQTVLTYCAVDVATTARAYQLMTAAAPDLE